ncbi:hypothetical protein M8C21_030545, partial [Ambrosia artemisiifolia]
ITSATSLGHQLAAANGDGNYECIDKERRVLHFKADICQDCFGLLSSWTREKKQQLIVVIGKESHATVATPKQTIPLEFGNITNIQDLYLEDLGGCTLENLDWLSRLSQLEKLCMSDLYNNHKGNQFKGSLLDDIQKFSSLVYLDLSNNQLNGTISEKVWELSDLQLLYLSSNFLRCVISKNIGKSKTWSLHLSNNSFEGVPFDVHISNHSYIEYISLRSCKLGPSFSKWIWKLKELAYLDISDTSILDTIPQEFWNMSTC